VAVSFDKAASVSLRAYPPQNGSLQRSGQYLS